MTNSWWTIAITIIKRRHSFSRAIDKLVNNDNITRRYLLLQWAASGCYNYVCATSLLQGVNICTKVYITGHNRMFTAMSEAKTYTLISFRSLVFQIIICGLDNLTLPHVVVQQIGKYSYLMMKGSYIRVLIYKIHTCIIYTLPTRHMVHL